MALPRHLRFVRALAFVATPAVIATPGLANDGGAAPHRHDPNNPYLNPGCPSVQPVEGATCSMRLSCSYGAGMCGPQCDCVPPRGSHRQWHCHTVCVGPAPPPELYAPPA